MPELGLELECLIERAEAACARSARLISRSAALHRRRVELTMIAAPDAPGVCREALTELAWAMGASEEVVEAVKLTVSEAVSNVVMHAYDAGAPGPVEVGGYVTGRSLTVLIADDGRGPRRPSTNPGLGLGWKLMTQLSERCTIARRGNGGTLVLMRFGLYSGTAASPDSSATA